MLILLVGTGIFLTVRTRFLTWRNLGYALKSTLSKEARTKSRGQGDVSPFSALTTSLAVKAEQPVEPNEYGWYFQSTFEGELDGWSGRGNAEVSTSGRTNYVGEEALLVQNRTAAWNGAARSLCLPS